MTTGIQKDKVNANILYTIWNALKTKMWTVLFDFN